MVRELGQRKGWRSFVVSQKSDEIAMFLTFPFRCISTEAKRREKNYLHGKTLQSLFIFCIIFAVAVRGHSMHSEEREKSRKIWLKLAAAEKVFSSSIRRKIVGKTAEKVLDNLSEFNHTKHALFMRSLHAYETNLRNFVQSWLDIRWILHDFLFFESSLTSWHPHWALTGDIRLHRFSLNLNMCRHKFSIISTPPSSLHFNEARYVCRRWHTLESLLYFSVFSVVLGQSIDTMFGVFRRDPFSL